MTILKVSKLGNQKLNNIRMKVFYVDLIQRPGVYVVYNILCAYR